MGQSPEWFEDMTDKEASELRKRLSESRSSLPGEEGFQKQHAFKVISQHPWYGDWLSVIKEVFIFIGSVSAVSFSIYFLFKGLIK